MHCLGWVAVSSGWLRRYSLVLKRKFISFFARHYIGRRNRTTISIFRGIGTKEAISLQAPSARPVARPVAIQ